MKHNNNTPLINTPRSRYTISFSDRDVWYVDNIEDELVQSKLSSDSSHIIRRTFPVSLKDLENKVLKDIKEDDERVVKENKDRALNKKKTGYLLDNNCIFIPMEYETTYIGDSDREDNQPEYEAFGCQYKGCINPTTPDSRVYCDQHIFPEERNPIITGDSDTDELLEDERIAQESKSIDDIFTRTEFFGKGCPNSTFNKIKYMTIPQYMNAEHWRIRGIGRKLLERSIDIIIKTGLYNRRAESIIPQSVIEYENIDTILEDQAVDQIINKKRGK